MQVAKVTQGILRGVFLLWPVLLLASLYHDAIRLFFWVSLALFLLRLALAGKSLTRGLLIADKAMSFMGAVICAACLAFNLSVPILWYPVVVNVSLLVVFTGSLFTEHTVVESLARLSYKDKPFPEEAIGYTRKVTYVWILFFLINGTVATLTALIADAKLWTLWNGCISYVLMGLLAAGEYLIRRRVCKR